MLMLGTFFLLMLGCTEYIRENYKLPWIEKKSLIEEGNPGVGFIPNIIKTTSPLIWYTFKGPQAFDNMKYNPYVDYLNKYLKAYDEAEKNKHNYSNCENSKEEDKPCIFLRKHLGPCGAGEFGYPDKKPCIYIKINKLPEWVPEYYTGYDLPEEMPHSLKTAIKTDSNKKKLWVHCDGVYPPDSDHIGALSYYPHRGIMGYYFPYDGNKHYITPLVAVKVDNIKKGYAVNMRCSVWAKNIRYTDPRTHSAYIQMYLAMD
ncbi:hypothetical protein ILUMI_00337 [Ignelater luminosus]|uniref:Sodium/potassium-transporting ATPase subunit beta-2 n=1 Tax=Ignelater luminosus TaxID=2038154 RepID=A0A8K0DKE9_IGNLU|nr:hypothetical protein ILUMI_00337 [Ignelater luminosus]